MSSPRRIRRGTLAGVLAAGSALALAGTAAAAEPQLIVSPGSGVTTPSGAARTPDGSVWVADHVLGFCKVVPGAPGSVDATGMPWCGGGEAIVPPAGPTGATNVAYVPSSALTGTFIVSGTNSKAGAIWTIPWSMAGGIDAAQMKEIVHLGTQGEIVEGMSYTANEAASGKNVIHYTTKRQNQIWRVEDPVNCSGPVACNPGSSRSYAVGATTGGGGPVAAIGGKVYVGEITGLSAVDSPANQAGASGAPVTPVLNGPAGQVTGLAIDSNLDGGRLYVGTFGVAGGDAVWAMANGGASAPVPYATDFGGVQGVNAMADGSILVGDDPTVVAGTAGSNSSGRIWEMAATHLNVPRVTVTKGPRAAERQTSVGVEFSSRPGVAFECRIDPPAGDLEGGWEACGSGPTGSRSWSGLAEGAHRIELRAVDPDPLVGTGPRVKIGFAVDLTAPTVRIENGPGDHSAPLGALDMRFSSNEIASFECALDGASFDPCESPHRMRGIATGAHAFHVRAVDGAGNTSSTADWAFIAGAPGKVKVKSLAQIARGPVTARARIAGRSVIVRIPAPRGATSGRIIIERKGVKRANGLPTPPKTLVWTTVRLKPGKVNTFRWTPGSSHLGRVVNVRSINVLVRVGPATRRLGPGRAAILTSRGPFWATGPAVTGTVVKGGSTR